MLEMKLKRFFGSKQRRYIKEIARKILLYPLCKEVAAITVFADLMKLISNEL